MIHKVKLKVRDEERWLTSISYGYKIKFSDALDIDKIIQLHQEVSMQLDSQASLPLDGGLIRIRFSSTDHDQFFYEWLFTSIMEDGSIEFIQNEVETIERISFWDCYCVGVKEWMNAGGTPMGMELLLSPAIFKKGALVNEKVWKVTDIHWNSEDVKTDKEVKEDKEPKIIAVYWKDAKGKNIINEIPKNELVTLYAKTKDVEDGEIVQFEIIYTKEEPPIKVEGKVLNNEVHIENFNMRLYREKKTIENNNKI